MNRGRHHSPAISFVVAEHVSIDWIIETSMRARHNVTELELPNVNAPRGAPAQIGTLVRHQPLHEQAIDQLREMIVQGILTPGERISEKQLCETLGVSRTPLREALKVLANEGLVTLLARRGSIVSPLSTERLEERFEVVRIIETFAIDQIGVSDRRVLARSLQSICDSMISAADKKDIHEYYRLNELFHREIVASCGNCTLTDIHDSLTAHLKRARILGLFSHPIDQKFIDGHIRIVRLIRRGDLLEARREASSHLSAVEAGVLSVMRGRRP